jgi:hypothetical protein
MDDELRQVQEEIVANKEKWATAEDKRDSVFIEIYGNMLVRLYDEKARVEARLSAGEIYCNRGVCDIM